MVSMDIGKTYQLAAENTLKETSSIAQNKKCELFLLSKTMHPSIDLDAFRAKSSGPLDLSLWGLSVNLSELAIHFQITK